jgi:hypothetical protein
VPAVLAHELGPVSHDGDRFVAMVDRMAQACDRVADCDDLE